MLLVEVIILGLAGWRLAALLSYERGPWDVFLRMRKALDFEHNEHGEPVAWPNTFLGNLFNCVWCLSLYTVPLCWVIWRTLPEVVIMIVAASAVAVATERWNHNGSR